MTKRIVIEGQINMTTALVISELMLYDDVEILETDWSGFSAPMQIEMHPNHHAEFKLQRHYHQDRHRPRDLYRK